LNIGNLGLLSCCYIATSLSLKLAQCGIVVQAEVLHPSEEYTD